MNNSTIYNCLCLLPVIIPLNVAALLRTLFFTEQTRKLYCFLGSSVSPLRIRVLRNCSHKKDNVKVNS